VLGCEPLYIILFLEVKRTLTKLGWGWLMGDENIRIGRDFTRVLCPFLRTFGRSVDG